MKRKKNCFNKCLKTSTNKTKILTQSYVQYKQRQLSKEAELLNQVKRGENSQSDTENTCKKKKKKKRVHLYFLRVWMLSWHHNTCPVLSEVSNGLQWLHFASLKGDTFGSSEWKPFTARKEERQSSCLPSHDARLSQPTYHTKPVATKDINLWLHK